MSVLQITTDPLSIIQAKTEHVKVAIRLTNNNWAKFHLSDVSTTL
jgi:hypothetical protein